MSKVKIKKNSERIISDETIYKFENKINAKLPEDYKDFLKNYNGGFINFENRYFYYSINDFITIHQFFPLEKIRNEPNAGENNITKNWIAIAEDGDSGYIFLSLDSSNYGNIYYCDMVHGNLENDSILISKNFTRIITKLSKDKSTPKFEHLIESRKYKKLQELILSGKLDINSKNKNGETLLQLSTKFLWTNAEYFNEACNFIKFLLEKGVDKRKALFLRSPFEVFKIILDNGYNINEYDENGKTPLMWHSEIHWVEEVKFLIENGADVSLKDNKGKKAIDYAIEARKREYYTDHKEDFDIIINILQETEKNKFKEIAKEWRDEGLKLEVISNLTTLTIQEIENL